jgi:hypothetical protein
MVDVYEEPDVGCVILTAASFVVSAQKGMFILNDNVKRNSIDGPIGVNVGYNRAFLVDLE